MATTHAHTLYTAEREGEWGKGGGIGRRQVHMAANQNARTLGAI